MTTTPATTAQAAPVAPAKSGRPWQGTFLGVIDIIGVVLAFVFAILFLFMQGVIGSLLSGVANQVPSDAAAAGGGAAATGMFAILGGFTIIIGIILIGLGILAIFMAKGAFAGKKWSPILSIIFAGLGVLQALSSYSNAQITNIVLNAFIIYCAVTCLKNPFYASTK